MTAGYLAAVGWTLSLAFVDGWQRGLAGRLTTRHEYLSEVGGVTDAGAMLRGFTGRILDGQPDSWTTHVGGHPPGALLLFVWLDRLGLPGGGPAAIACVLAGAAAAVAVPVALRALGDEAAARAAVPFLALFPGAVWIGASADAVFTGVTATGIAAIAVATRLRGVRSAGAALLAGALLAFGAYLSYGLVLFAIPAVAVIVAARRFTLLGWAVAGAAPVAAAFTVAGFWWLDGYHLVVERYYQGIAARRPYAYWVWANLAVLAVSAGPAATVAVHRSVRYLLPAAAVTVVVAADLSGLSKAEVERIWLPFAVWLVAGAALLPRPAHRAWLATQAAVALTVNHLLLTPW
jgi:hypothetical protein